MIKILFFIETLEGGGAEKVLRNLVNHMDQTRFAITVQTVWPCDFEKYLVKGIRYKSVYAARSRFNRLRYRFEAETGLAYRLHIKDDYDIECAYLEAGATKIMSASTNKKAKKLAWVHCDFEVAFHPSYAEKTRKYYQKFDKVVCVSEKCRESFKKMFGDAPESVVLHNVVDEDEILQKALEKLPEMPEKSKFTLLCVGRLTPQKNPMRMLKTHKRLLDDGIDHELWWVGDGELRGAVRDEIERLGITETFKLLGFHSNPYPFMREADLLVCSSDYEGFSTFITEGLILGKPIITTECSGMRELLGDSEYGIITENNDEAFYQGLKELLKPQQENVYREMSEKAAVRGKSFSTRSQEKKTEEFFEGLMG